MSTLFNEGYTVFLLDAVLTSKNLLMAILRELVLRRSEITLTCLSTDNGEKVHIDLYDHTRQEVQDRLQLALCKGQKILSAEARARQTVANPANFGKGFCRHCICAVPGQTPCPGAVTFPHFMRRKYFEDPHDPDSPLKDLSEQ